MERISHAGLDLNEQVREHPWSAIGVAAGLGLVLGDLPRAKVSVTVVSAGPLDGAERSRQLVPISCSGSMGSSTRGSKTSVTRPPSSTSSRRPPRA